MNILAALRRLFRRRPPLAGQEPVLIAAQMTPIRLSGDDLRAVRSFLEHRWLGEDVSEIDTRPMWAVVRDDPNKTLKLPAIPSWEDLPPASSQQFHGMDTEHAPVTHLGDTRFAGTAYSIEMPRLRLPARQPDFRFHESEAATTVMRVMPWRKRVDANATHEMPAGKQ